MQMNTKQQVYPLTAVRPNEKVQIVAIQGGQNLNKRLSAMGMIEGSVLTVVQQRHTEGLVVRCQDTRWALGRGMAHKILVTPAKENVEGVSA